MRRSACPKEVERALNTSGAAFKSFEKSLDLLFITLGTQISPGIVEVVKSLTEFDVALKKVAEGKDSPFKPLSDSLGGALGEFSKVIDAVTKNLPAALQNVDFSGLIRSFDGLFGELDTLFTKFFGEIDVTTVEGLSAALQKDCRCRFLLGHHYARHCCRFRTVRRCSGTGGRSIPCAR